MSIDTTPDADFVDEDADLTSADRGDDLETEEKPEETEADAKVVKDDLARGKDGKITKKPAAEETSKEDEEEEEEETAAKDDEEEDDSKTNFPIRLNKAKSQRDAATARAEAAEAALRAITAQQAPPKAAPVDPLAAVNAELDTLYTQVEEARADGDSKTAAALQRRIDGHNRAIMQYEAERVASRATSVSSQNARFDAMLDVLEANVSALDPQHEDYSADVVKELDFNVRAYEKMGMGAPDALRKASNLLFGQDLFAKRAAAVAPKAVVKAEPAKAADKKVDVAKAVSSSSKQPPDTADRGLNKDDTAINPETLSEEEFNALPASKLRQMRGDFAI